MGAPVDPARSTRTAPHANPMGTEGLAFIEFSAHDPAALEKLFTSLGFVKTATHNSGNLSVWTQNEIKFLLNSDAQSHGGRFAAEHGSGISGIGFKVGDAAKAFEKAIALGARAADAVTAIQTPVLDGIGGSLLYLIDNKAEAEMNTRCSPTGQTASRKSVGSFSAVDHLTHNVCAGNLQKWADFYKDLFGFREIFYLDMRGSSTGFRTCALMSPCDGICIPINEPTDARSQIQEFIDIFKGEGVQHIALATTDIHASVENVAGSGISFMQVPNTYYDAIDTRLESHGEDLERLKRNAILLDGERSKSGGWDLLLQIFSKNLIGPIFFEFIQRKGNTGFGEGNARALFDAIERDQIERGFVLSVTQTAGG